MNIYEAFSIYMGGVSCASSLAWYLLYKAKNMTFENSFYAAILSLWGSWITFVIFLLIAIFITTHKRIKKIPHNRNNDMRDK